MTLWIILAGGLLVLGLSIYAGMLLTQLYKQNQRTAVGEEKRLAYLHESIATIALAMQQKQCELSEGCIRLVVLLENLPQASEEKFPVKFPVIHSMYEKIKHMPTHKARQQYPKKEIAKMDREREQFERELEEGIQTDVNQILIWVKSVQK